MPPDSFSVIRRRFFLIFSSFGHMPFALMFDTYASEASQTSKPLPRKISTTLAGSSVFRTADASSPLAKAYIYSTLISLSRKTSIAAAKPPGRSSIPIATTCVSATVKPSALSTSAAFCAWFTIRRKIPNSLVSAIESARISTSLFFKILVISKSYIF